MKQETALADFLDYANQVIDIHGSGPVLERYRAVLEVFEEYQDYRDSVVGSSSDLESVTAATAGGSPVLSSGPFKIH